jgi:hypothetical protein
LPALRRAVEIAFSGKKIESLPTNRFVQGRVVRPSIDAADISAGRAECKRSHLTLRALPQERVSKNGQAVRLGGIAPHPLIFAQAGR